MASYEVRLSRTEYTDISVEAESVEDAYGKAVSLIEDSGCIADFAEEWNPVDGITIGKIRLL